MAGHPGRSAGCAAQRSPRVEDSWNDQRGLPPGERRALDDEPLAADLRGVLGAFREKYSPVPGYTEETTLSEERIEELRALGYVP